MLMDSKSLDNVFIMKRSPFHNRAGKQHRLKIGHRGYHPHATDFKRNEAQAGQGALCRKFVCNRPAGRFGCIAKIQLLAKTVDLENKPVSSDRQLLALLVKASDETIDLLDRIHQSHQIADLESP